MLKQEARAWEATEIHNFAPNQPNLFLKFCGCSLLQSQNSVGACTHCTRSNSGPVCLKSFSFDLHKQGPCTGQRHLAIWLTIEKVNY